jgi:hypothetical protein
MADGFWLLFSLPRQLLIALVGGQPWPTVHLALGMGLGFLALILLSGLREPERQRTVLRLTAGVLSVTVFAMIGLRDVVRAMYLSPAVRLRELPRTTQTDVTILFFVVLILGLGTVAWMVRSVVRERRAQG